MHKAFLMGNEALALGALAAGVNVVSGYPGTPSTEVLETIARQNPGNVYIEWSINEKAAMEVAAGAAYTGARALVTMKQVGLNVASDPLMSLEYIGVKGGMVVLVADDPGPISSQTEQDTRTFGMYSKLPVFDPSSVQEAYEMIQEAFAYSEEYHTPVFLRPTTRIDHGYASIEVKDTEEYLHTGIEGFVKDSSKWVIFPRLSVVNHARIEERNQNLTKVFSAYDKNQLFPACGSFADAKRGIVSHGISFAYTMDNLDQMNRPKVLKVATPFPFPEELAEQFMEGLTEVLVIEELDPVLERALIFLCGKRGIPVKIHGKLDGTVKCAGENTMAEVNKLLTDFLEIENRSRAMDGQDADGSFSTPPALPVRPPVLCAGCPHRASFYAVKQAMKGQKTIYCGDIGCYTLGNAQPLDMCDTCLCMGAGINIAQGVWHVEPDTKAFAFVGDSTFFASGITGAVNGFYNQADMTLVILDNSTTAMTGHQPHPGTGTTMMGEVVEKVDMEQVLRGIGIKTVETVNPLDLKNAVETVRRVAGEPGMKAIIFRYPCIVKYKPKGKKAHVDADKCISCKKCISELGCPGVIMREGKAYIDESLCTGCTLCEQVCPVHAIDGGEAGSPVAILAASEGVREKKEAPRTQAVKTVQADTDTAQISVQRNIEVQKNIVMSGVGGQGTILASKLIATAAMNVGLPVKTAETIGMAQRGGSVFSHLRLGEGIYSPLLGPGEADLIIGFEPAEAVRMLPYLKKGGTVVTSTRPIMPVSAMIGASKYDVDEILSYLDKQVEHLVLVDVETALQELGNDKVLNILLLGAAADTGELGIDKESIRAAIRQKLPEKLHELNFRALDYI
ncbi:MAG: indolepyruvate ferredoxin oxidoreductase subunit alpha [Lachnospiraceae bacterium]|nr:indolepyruvate ferredoxin oxidoreductase subunit alpha [Lachnospiraceae bacterium]